MKLYMHPASSTSRPVRLLIAERKLPVEEQLVDIFTGEHMKEPYTNINPNKLVPTLEDGDFVLTESQAILQYLADRFELHDLYPTELKARARINERLDWFNTNFYREFGYGLCYPQIFPHHKRPSDDIQKGTIEWARERARNALKVLDEHYIGNNDYTCGTSMSIADFSGACMVTMGDVLRIDWAPFPNVQRWLGKMKALPTWNTVNEVHDGFSASVKDQEFVTL